MLVPLQAQEPAPYAKISGHLLYVNRRPTEKVRAGWSQVTGKRPELAGSAFLRPDANGWTGLAVKAIDKLPPEKATEAAKELSAVLKTEVLHLALSPDGRAWYFLWEEGNLVDRYCSNPGKAGEIEIDLVRSWQGRPELLVPVSRGTPLSKTRTEVSITDFNGFLYFYYPEMKTTRPESWRSPTDLLEMLAEVVGVPEPPAPFHSVVNLPGWIRL
jgi:hypothetical protein